MLASTCLLKLLIILLRNIIVDDEMFLYDVDYIVCVIGFQSVYVNNRELFASHHTFVFHIPLNTAWFRCSPPWLRLHVRSYSRVTNYQYQHVYLTVSVLGGDGGKTIVIAVAVVVGVLIIVVITIIIIVLLYRKRFDSLPTVGLKLYFYYILRES